MPKMTELKSKTDLKVAADVNNSVEILARMIYQEAGNQSDEGKRGVAFVAQNRHGHSSFPSTYYEVIVSSNQFAVALKYKSETKAEYDCYDTCYSIAGSMSSQTNPIGSRLYFCRTDIVKNLDTSKGNGSYSGSSSKSFTDGKTIGDHIFYS